MSAIPESAAPSSMTVVPPSGTEWKDKLSVKVAIPFAGGSCTENEPLKAVVSKPIALTVPAIKTLTKPAGLGCRLEEVRLNVNVGPDIPVAVQKAAIGPELKLQGDAKATGWPPAEPKSVRNTPEVEAGVTTSPNQLTTAVAPPTVPEFNWAEPAKPMLPVIGTA